MKRRPQPHDVRIFLLSLLAGLPAVLATLGLLAAGDYSAKVTWTVGAVVVVVVWLAISAAVRERVLRPLQTASNLVAALREGDFSVRGRGARLGDPLGELMLELNELSGVLREQRLGSLEAGALLQRVMDEIEVAVFAFDERGRAVLANRAGERLLGAELSRLPSSDARQLGLGAALLGPSPRNLELTLPGGAGKFELRRSTFRLGGKPHQLLVLADLRRALREEERQAWQRLVRVLGHEINNSLAPIHSIAQSVQETLRAPAPHDDELRAAGAAAASAAGAGRGGGVGAADRGAGEAPPGRRRARARGARRGGRRPARPAAHQPGAQRGRRLAGDARRRDRDLERGSRPRRSVGARRRAGHRGRLEPLRTLSLENRGDRAGARARLRLPLRPGLK